MKKHLLDRKAVLPLVGVVGVVGMVISGELPIPNMLGIVGILLFVEILTRTLEKKANETEQKTEKSGETHE